MNGSLGSCSPSKAVTNLLTLRRNLADSDYLQTYFYTRDESKFVDGTYVYWIRLHCDHSRRESDILPAAVTGDLRCDLVDQLKCRVFQRVPAVFSELVKLSASVKPESSIRECLAERELRIKQRLPTCIPYATCFSEINRLIRQLDVESDLRPSAEEIDALLEDLSQNALRRARARFPDTWDEVKGHYVLDSRGANFAKTFSLELKRRGFFRAGTRFIDLGSGTGTMVAAVNLYTDAHVTGVERHAGLMRLAEAMLHRLNRKCCNDLHRVDLITGNFLQPGTIDWSRFDVLYVYSPIGRWEIGIDAVIKRMHPGAILAMSNRPQSTANLVEEIAPVAGLTCFRRLPNR